MFFSNLCSSHLWLLISAMLRLSATQIPCRGYSFANVHIYKTCVLQQVQYLGTGNTYLRCEGVYHFTAGLQFDWIGFTQTRNYDAISRYVLKVLNSNESNWRQNVHSYYATLFFCSLHRLQIGYCSVSMCAYLTICPFINLTVMFL